MKLMLFFNILKLNSKADIWKRPPFFIDLTNWDGIGGVVLGFLFFFFFVNNKPFKSIVDWLLEW